MAKKIEVSEEVFRLLKMPKPPEESFSAAIAKGLRKGTIAEIEGSGTISRSDWQRARKEIANAR